MQNNSELIIYTTADGITKVDVTFEDETVWLTQELMAELFQKSKSTIIEHIKNIYSEGELNEADTMRKFGNSEFSKKPTNYFRKNCQENLTVILWSFFTEGGMFNIESWETKRNKRLAKDMAT